MRDVVVVGAGPAGLHAASRLAARGLDVAVLEAKAQVGEGAICSGVISEEAFAKFDLPNAPVLTNILSILAISPGGRKLEHKSETPLARVVDKKAFNRALGERAIAAGARIELGRSVEAVERGKDSVVLRLRSPEGEVHRLEARVAVIAMGVNGSLNRTLGLAQPRQFLRAMQAEITLPSADRTMSTRVYVGRAIAPGAFAWEIPLGQGRVRLGIMTTCDPRPFFSALLRRTSPDLDASQVNIGQKGIAQASVGRCAVERVVAVGEAAGHVKTSTGGGIYYGLLSAELAVRALLRAFEKGDFTSPALSEFELAWRAAFGQELLVGYFARELASRFPDGLIDRVFEAASSRNLLERLNGRLKFDWHQKALLATMRTLMLHPGGMGHV